MEGGGDLVDGEVVAGHHAPQLSLCHVVPTALRLVHYAGLHVPRLLVLQLHIPAPPV